jgi:hypothetical protein
MSKLVMCLFFYGLYGTLELAKIFDFLSSECANVRVGSQPSNKISTQGNMCSPSQKEHQATEHKIFG